MSKPWQEKVQYVPEPVESAPLRTQVYQRLEKLIIEGQYRPGDRLPEPELAKLLSVSRGPVREALQQLERDGWVEVRPRHGATVRRRTLKEVSEFFDIRRALEIHAARLATLNITPAGAALLKNLMEESHKAEKSSDNSALMAANWAVHRAIPQLSGNSALAEMIDTLGRRVRWYTFTPRSWRRAPAVLAEHQMIVDAILGGDADKAAALMDEHISHTWTAYQEWAAMHGDDLDGAFAPQPDA